MWTGQGQFALPLHTIWLMEESLGAAGEREKEGLPPVTTAGDEVKGEEDDVEEDEEVEEEDEEVEDVDDEEEEKEGSEEDNRMDESLES